LSTYTEVGISKNNDADQKVIDSFQPSEESLENFATEVFSNLPENEKMISRHHFADNIFDRISKHFFKPCEYNKKKKVQSKVILLAGTSGTGKSTIATQLCLKYNLHLIQTDSIRTILRQFTPKDSDKILFSSTYNCGKYVMGAEDDEEMQDVDPEKSEL
jgi:2-phosphoglycerate kinase